MPEDEIEFCQRSASGWSGASCRALNLCRRVEHRRRNHDAFHNRRQPYSNFLRPGDAQRLHGIAHGLLAQC